MMTATEIWFYDAGIKDALYAGRIVRACESSRYKALSEEYNLQIGKEALGCLKAYDAGVAYCINHRAKLGF